MFHYDDSLTAPEVARILGIGRNAVYDLAKSGQLRSYKMGRKLLFALEDVYAFRDMKRGISRETLPASPAGISPVEAFCPQAPLASHASSNALSSSAESTALGQPAEQGPSLATSSVTAPSTTSRNGSDQAIDWSVAPLVGPAPGLVISGQSPLCLTMVSCLQEMGVSAASQSMNDYAALVGLYSGRTAGALVTLYDGKTNRCNVPFVQRLVPGTSLVVLRVATQDFGLAVAPGNPKSISTWSSLYRSGVRMANRPRGSAERVLLDEKSVAMEACPSSLEGYGVEEESAFGALRLVAAGVADACVCSRQAASSFGGKVLFKPLISLDTDLILLKTSESAPHIRRLKAVLVGEAYRAALSGRYAAGTSKCGCVIYEC